MNIKLIIIKLLILIPTLILATTAASSDLEKGRNIYQKNCQMCHGHDGKNTMATAANFKRGKGLFQSDSALLERIKKGDKACPGYLGILKEQQIFDVIAYIRTLYK